MDYSRFCSGKAEPFYSMIRPYHNEVIVWWAVLFIFLKAV